MSQNTVSTLKSQSFRLDELHFSDCFKLLRGPKLYWSAPGHPPVVASGCVAEISASGNKRFNNIRDQANEVFSQLDTLETHQANQPSTASPRFFGGFAFRNEVNPAGSWGSFGSARFYLPKVQFTETGGQTWLTVNGNDREDIDEYRERILRKSERDSFDEEVPNRRHIEKMSQHPRREQWLRNVQETLQLIRGGTLEKLVLAQQMDVRFDRPLDSEYLLSTLESASDSTYRFLFKNPEGHTFLGASPETLISQQGTSIETESLAGTVESGRTSEEKRDLAKKLASNPKNQREHEFVVDTIQKRLKDHVKNIHSGDQTVRSFPSVQHLYTPITGTVKEDIHILELAETLHPTPAVGGSPEETYAQYRQQFEPFERGWYASPIGWFDAKGNGRFAVAIRSARVQGRDATLYAGAGLVENSQPEKEWDEVQWKYQSLLDVLQK